MDFNNEIHTQELQGLIDYLSNIGCCMLDVSKDILYKEILKGENYNVLKLYASDRNTKLLCINKIENENLPTIPTETDLKSSIILNETNDLAKSYEIFLEIELKYKGQKSQSICFIKKDSVSLDNIHDKSFSSLLQVFNFNSEGNEMMIFSLLQNYIQNAFSPLFQSYQNTVVGTVFFKLNLASRTIKNICKNR